MQCLSAHDIVLDSLPLRFCVCLLFLSLFAFFSTFYQQSKKKRICVPKRIYTAPTKGGTDDGQTDGSTVMTMSSVLRTNIISSSDIASLKYRFRHSGKIIVDIEGKDYCSYY